MSDPTATRPVLTIAIPTFNRAHALSHQLELIVSAIREQGLSNLVDVLISDNASRDDTQAVVERARHPDVQIHARRNVSNLGCDANYLRLIEHARGRWCWLLGDDEPIDLKSLGAFVKRLETETADAIHLMLPRERTALGEVLFTSHESLIESAHELGLLQHLSTNVFRTDFARTILSKAYSVAGKLHAYSAVTLASIAQGSGLRLYDFSLIGAPVPTTPRWSFLPAILGAIETLVDSTEPRLQPAMRRKATRERSRAFLQLAVRDALGVNRRGLERETIERFLRVFPARQWPLLAPVGIGWLAGRSGALAATAGILERLSPDSKFVQRLRREYQVPAGVPLSPLIRAALVQPSAPRHDEY